MRATDSLTGLLRALACAAIIAVLAPRGAEAAEPPPPPGPGGGEASLAPADREAVAGLLSRLAGAMERGSPEAVGGLLSPDVPPARRSAILDDAEHEFANFRYPEYKLVLDRSVLVTRNDDGSLTLEPVRAVYRYESKSSKLAPAASEGRNSFRFTVVSSDGRWLIAESDLFDTFSRVTQAGVFSWAFFVIALSVVVIFFWGWMVLDCSIRYRNWKYSVALILTLPLGALYYFFTVWLRRPAGELGD